MSEEELIKNAAELMGLDYDQVAGVLMDIVVKGHLKLEIIDGERVYYSIPFFSGRGEVALRIVS